MLSRAVACPCKRVLRVLDAVLYCSTLSATQRAGPLCSVKRALSSLFLSTPPLAVEAQAPPRPCLGTITTPPPSLHKYLVSYECLVRAWYRITAWAMHLDSPVSTDSLAGREREREGGKVWKEQRKGFSEAFVSVCCFLLL